MTGKPAIALLGVAGAVATWTWPALAAVNQLDGTVLPQPTSAAELAVVTSRGYLPSDDTLSGLFQNFAGGVDHGLDPIADASTTPGTFDPTCGMQVSIVLKGGACALALGWYNASEPPSTPAADQIYEVVPANLTGAFPNGIGCTDPDFCPMASRNVSLQAAQRTWADPLPAFDPQIAANPNWKGGRVGFALIGRAGTMCTQTKYSEADLNLRSTAFGAPWITALVYGSLAGPGSAYLAFEDLPMSASDWKANGADGDFNDAVYFIAPMPCGAGAGSTDAATSPDAGRDAGATDAGAGTSGVAGAAGGLGAGGVPPSGGAGGASGGATGSGGQSSSTGGQVATGGVSGASGGAGGSPSSNGGSPGGGCSCQSPGGAAAGPYGWLVLVALAGLRRRSKSVQKSARIRRS
ncbi:MAG TPA: MYXO-CTERM sorting domain-containing protein [Polyangia bacterium]|nr:MYXO-CTERM sorting domain-containing protein [Polyangia bacterium]